MTSKNFGVSCQLAPITPVACRGEVSAPAHRNGRLEGAGGRFRDRREAGQALAAVLGQRSWEQPVVVGIAAGGVVLAAVVAQSLRAELGAVVARKLEAPYQPGLTLGAVTADNVAWVRGDVADEVGATEQYLSAEILRRTREARRMEHDLGGLARVPVHGRTVLVIDDGIVTGARALAALRSMAGAGARRAVFAAAAGPLEAFERVRSHAFEAHALVEDRHFVSIADFYDDFRPVGALEIRELLEAATRRRAHRRQRRASVESRPFE